jgi:hypothetical protein
LKVGALDELIIFSSCITAYFHLYLAHLGTETALQHLKHRLMLQAPPLYFSLEATHCHHLLAACRLCSHRLLSTWSFVLG